MELRSREVLKVRQLPGVFDYAATLPDGTASKMAGKQYKRYAYKDKVFAVNAEDKFNTDFEKERVYSVELTTNDEDQLSFAGHTTTGQEVKMKQTDVLLESITVDNYKLTENALQALANADANVD